MKTHHLGTFGDGMSMQLALGVRGARRAVWRLTQDLGPRCDEACRHPELKAMPSNVCLHCLAASHHASTRQTSLHEAGTLRHMPWPWPHAACDSHMATKATSCYARCGTLLLTLAMPVAVPSLHQHPDQPVAQPSGHVLGTTAPSDCDRLHCSLHMRSAQPARAAQSISAIAYGSLPCKLCNVPEFAPT